MANKKRTARHETLLSTVARKLGHAAGTLAKATQELKENLVAIPESVAAKARESANMPAGRSRARIRHPKKRIRRITQAHDAARSRTQKVPKRKSPRGGPRASNLKK